MIPRVPVPLSGERFRVAYRIAGGETEALALVETSPVHAVAIEEQGRIVGLLRRDDIRRRVSSPSRRTPTRSGD